MPSAEKVLLVRADADDRMGSGHVMRCLALAQTWQEVGGQVTFLSAIAPGATRERLASENVGVVDLSAEPGGGEDAVETIVLAGRLNASWVVTDGYHIGADHQRAVKDAGLSLLCVDDYGHAGCYCCDLVVNQNVYATESFYLRHESHTRLLLGLRYALLRREFRAWGQRRRETPQTARRILVTLGGGDPENVTLKVIHAIQQAGLAALEAVVIAGGTSRRDEQLRAAVADSRAPIRLERSVTNMPELMAWADMAVSGGGGTCSEMAYMGLPNLVLILAENQRINAETFAAKGAAVCLGEGGEVSPARLAHELAQLADSPARRRAMSRKGQELVDANGGKRVVGAMGESEA